MDDGKEAESKEEVCKELDELVLAFFSTLTDLYQEQAKLEESLKSGFLNMSRARYSMGIKSVGIQQCDQNKMTALMKISVSDDNTMLHYNGADDLESRMNDLDLGGGVRRRGGVGKDEAGSGGDMSHVQDVQLQQVKHKTHSTNTVFDPLKWFGVLVPPALRQTQADFKKTAEITVAIANLKVKIQSIQTEYCVLQQRKNEKTV